MLNLQNIVIAVVAAFVIGLAGGSWLGWSLTSDYYQAKIVKTEAKAKQEIIVYQDKLIVQERTNNETTGKLNKLSVEFAAKRDADAASIAGLLRTNRWLRNPTVCKDPAGASPAASGPVADETTSSNLSEDFRSDMASILARADEAADYAEVAHQYALQVEAQRRRLSEKEKE